MKNIELAFRFGLFLLVAPSKAKLSNDAGCAEPMSTRYPSPTFCVMTPTTDSCGAGIY